MFGKEKSHELRSWQVVFLIVVLVFAGGAKLYSVLLTRWPAAIVHMAGQNFSVLVANSYQHRFEGWSNRKDMGKYQGMLFVFPERGQHTMVMRAMQFPLDIIWLDGTTIVDMAPHLIPEPNHRSEGELTPYFARLPSTMVLEMPSGTIAQYGLRVGDQIKIAY